MKFDVSEIDSAECILDMGKPLLRTWPEDCFLTSIILSQEHAYDWIMNWFVQICAYKSEKKKETMRISFYPEGKHHFRINLFDLCPFISKDAVDNKWIKGVFNNFSDFVIYTLSNGYYLSVVLDQCYRPDMAEKHIIHPAYIYGYNSDKKIIYTADSYSVGRYSYMEVPFEHINKAFELINANFDVLSDKKTYMYRVQKKNYKYSVEHLICLLEDYLNARDSTNYEYRNVGRYYGVKCYDMYLNYIDYILECGRSELDLRSFVFLVDYHSMMQWRVEYLIEKGYLAETEGDLLAGARALKEFCEKTLYIIIKYTLTQSIEYLMIVRENVMEICRRNIEITEKLLGKIKSR